MIEQSGNVTPGHLASWATDGVLQDSGVALTNLYGDLVNSVLGINFNAIADNVVPVNLPQGYTRYRVDKIIISGATASLTTARIGVFTATGGTGIAVVAASTVVTVNTSLLDTNNNMQSLTIANQDTLALSDTVLYFRVSTPQGSPAQGNVSIFYKPLP